MEKIVRIVLMGLFSARQTESHANHTPDFGRVSKMMMASV
jgi:hypothetical protein